MALLTLEDHTGRIEVIVFPKSFRMSVKEIFQDNIIYVEGRFNTDERETKIIASNIRKLPNQITEVHLAIPAYLENALVQKELKRIFESYSGNDEVYLHLLGSKKVVKTDKSFWVDSTKAKFKEEITKVLGKDCFI